MRFAIIIYCVFLKIVVCKQNAIVGPTNTTSTTNNPLLTPQSAKEPEIEPDTKMKKGDLKIDLEYKPTRPSFLPVPSTIPQLISSGKPWPARPEEYNTSTSTLSPQLVNRFPELTSTVGVTKTTIATQSTSIVLGYKPQRPWYFPETDTLKPIIPPGKPWPANAKMQHSITDEVQRDRTI